MYATHERPGMTQRQNKVFNLFREFYFAHGYTPTVRRLAALDDGAISNIHRILEILVDKGWLGKCRPPADKLRTWNCYFILTQDKRRI